MARDFAKALYKSARWQKTRGYILKRDRYMCQCYKLTNGKQCFEPAEEIHHKTELTPENINNDSIAYGEDNLISLSRDCHFKIHEAQRNRKAGCGNEYIFDVNGRILKIK